MIIYILISIVEAAPIIVDRAVSPVQLKRTLFGIAWGCISTLIICTWTSIHPNVLPANEWEARWNRLKLIFWMIVTPELVLAWAVRQYFAAKDIRDTYNAMHPELPAWKKWTLKHGFFLEMGGFTLVDPDRRDAAPSEQNGVVLTTDRFREFLHSGLDISYIAEITAGDINDRSKGDAVWKIIATLQTTWFILQCIARSAQGLALTELELVTLALTCVNRVTFVIWWHKPLGVLEPIRIYQQTYHEALGNVEDTTQYPSFDLSFRDVISKSLEVVKEYATLTFDFLKNPCQHGPITAILVLFLIMPICITYTISLPVFILFPLGIILLLRIIDIEPVTQEASQSRGLLATQILVSLQRLGYRSTSVISGFVKMRLERIFAGNYDGLSEFIAVFLFGWFILLPSLFFLLLFFVLFLVPFFALVFLVSFIFTAVFGITTTSTVRHGASHVPLFYAPVTKSDRWSRMVIFALFGVIFGGIHCIGWNFPFPTYIEQILWRATSLAITIIPVIVAPIDFLLATRDIVTYDKFERIVLLALDLIMTIMLFVYVLARLSLLAQAPALLRNLPQGAFVAVDWTNYVPHIFS